MTGQSGELGEACGGGHGRGGVDVPRAGHHHPQVVLNHSRKKSLNNKRIQVVFKCFVQKILNVSRSTGSFPTSFLSQIEADGVGEFHRQTNISQIFHRQQKQIF